MGQNGGVKAIELGIAAVVGILQANCIHRSMTRRLRLLDTFASLFAPYRSVIGRSPRQGVRFPPMKSPFLDLLSRRVLIFDGAMGTQLHAANLSAADYGGKEGCVDYLSITRPDVVESVHTAYFDAGADVVETNSFQASGVRLAEWGLGERTVELNRAAASIARGVADRYAAKDGKPRFAARAASRSDRLRGFMRRD